MLTRITLAAVAGFAAMLPAISQAQPATCSSPVFEQRLVDAVAKGEAQLKAIPAAKTQDYARCYARVACASLSRIEFEMYALSAITSYGNDSRAEAEYLGRMRQQRRENNTAGDKLPPKTLETSCQREIGLVP